MVLSQLSNAVSRGLITHLFPKIVTILISAYCLTPPAKKTTQVRLEHLAVVSKGYLADGKIGSIFLLRPD